MNLCFDCGNTTVRIGLFERGNLIISSVFPTRCLSLEPGKLARKLKALLPDDLKPDRIGIVSVISSDRENNLVNILENIFRIKPGLFNRGAQMPIRLAVDNPCEVGADRALGAWYAFQKYAGPIIVVDFGTATTFDLVSEQGEFLGGIIAPGVAVSFSALSAAAVKLPEIGEFGEVGPLIGKNSLECMRSAYYHGTAALVKGLIGRMREAG